VYFLCIFSLKDVLQWDEKQISALKLLFYPWFLL